MEKSPYWEADTPSVAAFYGTWRFITASTEGCQWSQSWARCILFTPSYH